MTCGNGRGTFYVDFYKTRKEGYTYLHAGMLTNVGTVLATSNPLHSHTKIEKYMNSSQALGYFSLTIGQSHVKWWLRPSLS